MQEGENLAGQVSNPIMELVMESRDEADLLTI